MRKQVWDDSFRRRSCAWFAMPKAFGRCKDKIDNLLSAEWDDLKEAEKSLRTPQMPAAGVQVK